MYLSPEGIQPVEFGAEWACLLGSLRYRQFDGRPVVHVSPAIWGVDPATIRQAAHDRRYVEIPPAGPTSSASSSPRTRSPGGSSTTRRPVRPLRAGNG